VLEAADNELRDMNWDIRVLRAKDESGAADPDARRQTSHYLRSGALALRLEWIAEQAHRLEFLAVDDFNSASYNRLVANLRTEVNAVVVALLDEVGDSGAA